MFFSSVTERFSNPPEATIFTGNGLASAADLVTQNRLVFQLNRSANVLKNVTGGGFYCYFPHYSSHPGSSKWALLKILGSLDVLVWKGQSIKEAT